MYELLIKLYYELDYKKFKLEELKEIRDIIKQFRGEILEVKVKKITTNK